MEKLNNLVNFLNEYLKINEFKDDSWNGLQVECSKEIKKVAFSVSAGLDVFKKAKDLNADLLIVHHGIFWKEANPSLKGWVGDRASFLVKNNISFYAVHLPLDAHPELGNNAQLLKILNAEIKEPIGSYSGQMIGFIGECAPVKIDVIVDKLEKEIGAKCQILKHGKEEITKIAIISGGAPMNVFDAIDKGVDLFITGDAADVVEIVKDAKINVIFAGHYATETTGVKALLEVIKNKFNVEVFFIDSPTGF